MDEEERAAPKVPPRNFTSFLQHSAARYVSATAAAAAAHLDQPQNGGLPIEQMAEQTQLLFSPTGRATTLSRGNVPAAAAAVLPAGSTAPRAPPTAGAPYVNDGASEALDLRSLALGSWALVNAEYHLRRAREAVTNAEAGGSGTVRVTQEPFDPYECPMDHVAWCLTAPHTPFEPCMMGDNCAGKTLANVFTTKSFVLKAYVSLVSRKFYERTGVLQPVDEHAHPHPGLCIVDLLALNTCMAKQKLADNEASGCIFPPFYNPTGRQGTYAPSALCSFSRTKLNGVTRAYRYFLSDQLVLGKLQVIDARADPSTKRLVTQLIEVDALLENHELVDWRSECETDPHRAVWLHDARPATAPQTRPAKPPVAAEVHHTTANTVVTPKNEINSAAKLVEARKPVEHLLPRMPAPIDITYGSVLAASDGHTPAATRPVVKTPRKRAPRKPAATPAKRKARGKEGEAEENDEAEGGAPMIKQEPVEAPPSESILRLRSIIATLRGGQLVLKGDEGSDVQKNY